MDGAGVRFCPVVIIVNEHRQRPGTNTYICVYIYTQENKCN